MGRKKIEHKVRVPLKWHASQESDEMIFSVCDRYFMQLGHAAKDEANDVDVDSDLNCGAATGVARWVQKTKGRSDITREKIYPMFWEACHRGFLLLQPPPENLLCKKLTNRYALYKHPGEVTVINVSGETAAQHVTSTAADTIIELIERVWREKKEQFPNDPEKQAVHLGMGAGYATMLVARRLAYKIRSGAEVPHIVLHAISSGGFLPHEPHKSPSTYFSFFDPALMNVKFVALFSATVVSSDDYEKQKSNPAIRYSFEQRDDIDIIVTSLAAADHRHGLLEQYLTHLVDQQLISPEVLKKMHNAGWVGDVQFRPYSADGPLPESVCPVRAVTLFELDELVQMANERKNGKYIVLVAGPCGECGESKKHALQPLLANEKLRLWTHLIVDAKTAKELLD
ncbi:MAG: hypothetical protein LBH00_13060 [Planctomycetaceae bacterium]|jgi:hypothetical protein|nr:hypothetical protein [Planctomycetaceae bacterium]